MSRRHLLSIALQSHVDELPGDPKESSANVQQAPEQTDQTQQPTQVELVAMKGPLAAIFSRALDIVYAKPDSITGVGVESQANDQISAVAQLLQENSKNTDATIQHISSNAVYKSSREKIEPIAVIREIANICDQVPVGFTFYQDCAQPAPGHPTGAEVTKLLPGIESIEIVVNLRK